jgi:geranylgeranyl reductase family protein
MRCEVVVVGGGPAGATAARFLAAAGGEVVLFERDPDPRDKPCGGGLRPSVLSAFPHIKALSGRFLEATSTRGIMASPGAPDISYTSPPGEMPVMYQVRRSVFDRVLLDDAVDAGAQVEVGVKVDNAAGGTRGWRLGLSDGREVETRAVVGAGGARCPLGRRLRAAARGTVTFPRERLAVAWMREFHVGQDFIEQTYGEEHTVRIDLREGGLTGYAWTFPKREHVNVGFGALVGDLAQVDSKAMAMAYADRLKSMGLLPEEPTGGTWMAAPIPMGGPPGPVTRPGALSLGDCAGLVSPLSGDGIYYAIESGRLAAEVLNGALETGDLGAERLAAYGTAMRNGIGREMAILTRVATRLRSEPVEMLRRAAADPSIPPLVVQMFQGEGNLRMTALKVYGRSLIAGLRK